MNDKNNLEQILLKLAYPFDANYILSKKRKIKRELLDSGNGYVTKNIAILGGYTTKEIKDLLEIFLLYYGIQPQFYESEYNHYYEDAMFPNEELETFHPDIIYICTSNRNITRYPDLSDSAADVEQLLEDEKKKYYKMWDRLAAVYHCPVIQNNFELPLYRLMGNKDASDVHGAVNFITRLNMFFYSYAQEHKGFYICDINYISADYGLKEWSDPFYWYMYKYAVNVSAIPYLSYNVANIIKSVFGKNKKGLVLDLDNTLWGGIIGDDGVENIVIGPEESEGQAYLEFQNYIKKQKSLGVLLSINSKNDEENAIAGLNHPDGVLHPDDFVQINANWEQKDINHKKIADSLCLLPESLVFIDDNPAERNIVKTQIPGVCAPEIGQIQHYIQVIDRSGFFEITNFSDDDLRRNEMYKENVQRTQLAAQFENYKEYLLSLQMKADIKPFEPVYIGRIAQLSNKSNQFNLTTKRYTPEEIEEVSKQKDYITLYGKLTDRFGDNGVVTVVIGKKENTICHIQLWLMSCRVLKRDMEYAMMDALIKECENRGVNMLRGYYYPTAKNKMVKDFYRLMGFEKLEEDLEGNSTWEYQISKAYKMKNKVIEVSEHE